MALASCNYRCLLHPDALGSTKVRRANLTGELLPCRVSTGTIKGAAGFPEVVLLDSSNAQRFGGFFSVVLRPDIIAKKS